MQATKGAVMVMAEVVPGYIPRPGTYLPVVQLDQGWHIQYVAVKRLFRGKKKVFPLKTTAASLEAGFDLRALCDMPFAKK